MTLESAKCNVTGNMGTTDFIPQGTCLFVQVGVAPTTHHSYIVPTMNCIHRNPFGESSESIEVRFTCISPRYRSSIQLVDYMYNPTYITKNATVS